MPRTTVSRRAFLRGVTVSAAGAVLAACQPKVVEKIVKETVIVEKESDQAAQQAGPGAITLRVLSRSGYNGDHYRVFFTKFQKDFPHIRIEELETVYGEIPKKKRGSVPRWRLSRRELPGDKVVPVLGEQRSLLSDGRSF